MTTLVFGGKNKSGKRLTGGGIGAMAANAAGAALNAGSSLLEAGANMVKGSAAQAQAGGGRRRRRSSRHGSSCRSSRHGGSRSRKLRKRTGKVRRHATRSYRKTKRTKRA